MQADRRLGLSLMSMLFLWGCGGDSITSVDTDDFPTLSWPVTGQGGRDWVINNYVDLDSGNGVRDYRGGSKSYNGHLGVDIDIPNFRWMDDDFPVVAAAAGEVTASHDTEFDRNVSCTGTWNYVEVTHADGSRAIYGHLKLGSSTVAVGTVVSAGQTLGVVGSSGCSTQPHLHFELRSEQGEVVDPFASSLWAAEPEYAPPLTFMDLVVQEGAITGIDDLKDPPPNILQVLSGSEVGIGLSMAGGGPGDGIVVTLTGGDGNLEYELTGTLDRAWRHTYWYWNRTVTPNDGTWTVAIHVNGTEVATHAFDVS